MVQKFSIAHLTLLQCPPPEIVTIAAKAGYDYVSLRITAVTASELLYPLVDDREMMRETKQRLADTGIKVLDVELARMDPTTEPETYFPFLEACGELGALHIICQLPDLDRSRATDRFVRLCQAAKPYGLTVNVEFPSWTETPNVETAAAIVGAADQPNGGILIDVLHFHRSGSSLEALSKMPREWFHFAHLCDAPEEIPSTTEKIIHAARNERLFLGEGGLNIRDILQCLPPMPYSLEIPNDRRLKEMGSEAFARQVLQSAKTYLTA